MIGTDLAADLERLRAGFGPADLRSDPLRYVRRYEGRADREVMGWLASALAFGRVASIFKILDRIVERLGPRPAETVADSGAEAARELAHGLRHRWIGPRALAQAIEVLGTLLRRAPSLESVFWPESPHGESDARPAIARFARAARAALAEAPAPGFGFLFPDPEGGAACKRVNLFLRWMLRPDDGLDLGLWSRFDPARLVIPLDTHVAFLGRALGLTRRRSPGWAMASEITSALAVLDPADPVKFDWALTRLGILGKCPERTDTTHCPPCPLFRHCAVGRRLAKPPVRRRTAAGAPARCP